MKSLKVRWTLWLRGVLCFSLLGAWVAGGAEPTAFELIKEGNRSLGEQSKDKVLEIHSDKSVASLTPNIWYVVYFDPDATSKRAEVKFGAGRQMGIKHNWRPLGGGGSVDKLLDLKKLKIDSDHAIKIATAEHLLDKLTIKASQLWLENSGAAPIWKVRLWAAKLNKPDATVDIGEIFISAESGEVVKSDLRINKVD
ncbi:MAG: hypothetical protein ABSD29_16680 [Verrucomicrobiota bacterium]|jgi:hypothetical protein